ncbi:E3 ubiquitin-protein ligase RNF213-like [Sycon ciliatum]|uniref:E3 ubiquitin-protein ligase RNF213-like n=1 Tax=Sycon ciliatum TaxID=27933 RepID=UPI0031F653CC
MLKSVLTWTCWPLYIRQFWCPDMKSQHSNPVRMLQEDGQDTMQRGMSSLHGLLERLTNGSILVNHVLLAKKYSQQLRNLCTEIDNASNAEAQTWPRVELQLEQCIQQITAIKKSKEHLEALYTLCGTSGIDITVEDGQEYYTAVESNVETYELNELRRLFHFNDLVTEILPPFSIASTNPLFVRLCASQCDMLRDRAAEASQQQARQPLSMPMNGIVQQLCFPVFKHWSTIFQDTFTCSISLRLVEHHFKGVDPSAVLECMAESCRIYGLASEETYQQMEQWIPERVEKINRYFQLMQARDVSSYILRISEILELSGDFQAIFSIQEQTSDEFKDTALDALVEDTLQASLLLLDLTEAQITCLKNFSKCGALVSWLHEKVTNEKELRTFVDLATIATGESGDLHFGIICGLQTSCTGFSSLIYQLEAMSGFPEFMDACKSVFRDLEANPLLPTTLVSCFFTDRVQSLYLFV